MTSDELKKLIESGEIQSDSKVIKEGTLRNSSGESSSYSIHHGWDIAASLDCDESWARSNLELFGYIEQQNFDNEYLNKVLDSIQTEDHHWNWFKKSLGTTGDDYEWFYLYADSKPQAACLIFHPKNSALCDSNIFYVEFLAVAPWNRSCLVRERDYFCVGSTMLTAALKFAVNQLNLKPGFSLHSLPQASAYYEKLKMVNVENRNKETLLYFELPEDDALRLLGAA